MIIVIDVFVQRSEIEKQKVQYIAVMYFSDMPQVRKYMYTTMILSDAHAHTRTHTNTLL